MNCVVRTRSWRRFRIPFRTTCARLCDISPGIGDLLRESEGETLSERSKRFLNNMLESARFAGVLVDDLLTFSQMGRAALRPVSVDLNELVRSVAQEFSAETANRKVEWDYFGSADGDRRSGVPADRVA